MTTNRTTAAEDARAHPIQTVYGLVVVFGVLACGSMAAYHYGPCAEDLAEMIDQTAATVIDVPEPSDSPVEMLDEPAPFNGAGAELSAAPLASTESGGVRYDTAVQPVAGQQPLPLASLAPAAAAHPVDGLESERLTAPLLAAGASEAEVTPWGSDESRMYRASATAPAGAPASGLVRRYDAVAETPEAAVANVRDQLRNSRLR